jgi:hypothetical protein
MQSKARIRGRFTTAAFLVSTAVGFALSAFAPSVAATPTGTEHLLHAFAGGAGDGYYPNSTPTLVGTGTLYLTTPDGGKDGNGAVVKLTRGTSAWPESVIYSFTGGADGATPAGGVVADRSGSLYGVTTASNTAGGSGTVFKLTPSGSTWKESTIYTFKNTGGDGLYPQGRLLLDSAGDIYGTTLYGGNTACTYGCGTVFVLKPVTGKTTYLETILHRFTGGNDGAEPYAGLIADSSSALYGTTSAGGAYGQGIAFKMLPPATGGHIWALAPLHYFTGGSDGGVPKDPLLGDRNGNLFGTTSSGGTGGNGSVFRLAPVAGSTTHYAYRLLHLFGGYQSGDGADPVGGLVLGTGGILYGVTHTGGSGDVGSVYEMVPTSSTTGVWPEYPLYDFSLSKGYGFEPTAGLVRDSYGNLIGTTVEGYSNLVYGSVFEVVPAP